MVMRALCWHGKGDVRVDTVPPRQVGADDGVGTFDLVVNSFPDIMQQTPAPGMFNAGAQLVGDHGGEVRCLNGVP
jgi:hypothetical protein